MTQFQSDLQMVDGKIVSLIASYDALVEFGVAVWTTRICDAISELELKAEHVNHAVGRVVHALEILVDFWASEGVVSFNRRQPNFGWPDLTIPVLLDSGICVVGCLEPKEARRIHQIVEPTILNEQALIRIGEAYAFTSQNDRTAFIGAGHLLRTALSEAELQDEAHYLMMLTIR